MISYVVESFYGYDQKSAVAFNAESLAREYAANQRKAMPRWYHQVRIVKVTEEIIEIWRHN